MKTKDQIRQWAHNVGFDAVGFTRPKIGHRDRTALDRFLRSKLYGDMAWMAKNADVRKDPQVLWPEVKSVVVLGLNYAPNPIGQKDHNLRAGRISLYARNLDYHNIVKKRLKSLGSRMVNQLACQVKVFVDTAPVLEKALSRRSGIGWMGKHTNIVSRSFGSWLFLGEILTDLEIEPDPPGKNRCGSCDRCIRACPTGAIAEPYRLDPRQCISYLTIEHKGPIPTQFHELIENRLYGCDECLLACPWNRFAKPAAEPDFIPRPELVHPELTDLAELDDPAFRALFSKSPIKRIGVERFLRNVKICLKNASRNS